MYLNLKNGINLHYELKGNKSGAPLLFLHGNQESLHIYDDIVPFFNDYNCILVDSRCHGESSSGLLSYDLMANDIIELLDYLSINDINIVGFSDGAIISLILSIKTKLVSKQFLIGLNITPDGLTDDCIEYMQKENSIFSNLCLNEPNVSLSELKKVDARSILIYGDNDLIKNEHIDLINNNLNNKYLYIIKDADHFIPMNKRSDLIDIVRNELSLDVYYEDNHVLVVDKKAGVLSQEDDTKEPDILSIAKKYLKIKHNKPGDVYLGLISRLDRNVSGLIVLSKTTKATTRLNENRPKKTYLALVYGKTKEEDILIDYISKDEKTRTAYIDNLGKKAILHYKKIDGNDDMSLLDVRIETGRFHQIRFQLSNIGHPIYNDAKYNKAIIKEEYRIGLDAYKVEFVHPVKKEIIEIKRLPKDTIYKQFLKE